jgi:hypothetical protein
MLLDKPYQTAFVEEVSDEQIYRAGMEDWVGTVASMWELIGKPVDEKRLNLYCKQLSIVPLGLLEKGIDYAVRNNTYNNIPPIGTIWEGIRKELVHLNMPPGTDIKDMIDRWNHDLFKRCFHHFG